MNTSSVDTFLNLTKNALGIYGVGKEVSLEKDFAAALLIRLAVEGRPISIDDLVHLFYDVERVGITTAKKNFERPWDKANKLLECSGLPPLSESEKGLSWQSPNSYTAFLDACAAKDWEKAYRMRVDQFLSGYDLKYNIKKGSKEPQIVKWLNEFNEPFLEEWQQVTREYVALLDAENRLLEAIRVQKELCEVDPYNEDDVKALITLLKSAKKIKQARETFEKFEAFCEAERLPISPELVELYASLFF
jgi:DNA-binding SARP family transcriptional activator